MKNTLLNMAIGLLLTSCNTDNEILEQNFSTISNEFEEIETQLSINNNKIETEGTKLLTGRSEKTIAKIKEKLQNSYYKQISYLRSNDGEGEVGVLQAEKYKCGIYKEMVVYMDCEDSGNGASKYEGWTGSSYIDNNKNAVLRFCIVPTSRFQFNRGYEEYAVLLLGGQRPNGINTVTRYFDNEKNNNTNDRNTTVDGQPYQGQYGACNIGGQNTTLVFLHYLANSTPSSFPNLGFAYGVFGQLGANRGYLQTDDDDTDPSSTCMVDKYNGSGYTTSWVSDGKVGTILEMDIDKTRMNMSKIQ